LKLEHIAKSVANIIKEALKPVFAFIDASEKKQIEIEKIYNDLLSKSQLTDAEIDNLKSITKNMDLVFLKKENLHVLEIPHVQKMIDDAVAAIPTPVAPEPLPDIAKMIADAIPAPEPVVIPDVQKMIDDAIAALPVPAKPEPLPDIQKMVNDAVAAMPAPEKAENGRDGTDIDILPGIDFEKSYQRGTYATHNGGLWKAHTNTIGERGWECIVRGVYQIDVSKENDRDICLKIQFSDGGAVQKTISLDAMIYRGVYADGSAYVAGDTVTWAGSLWHCNEATSEKPGNGKSWTLSVKQGRNGRDAKPVIDLSGGVKI
jgi:hypothetical protein